MVRSDKCLSQGCQYIFQSLTGKLQKDSSWNIFHAVSGKSGIVPSLTGQSETVPAVMGFSDQSDLYGFIASAYPLRLSWSHYSIILQEQNAEARAWYENEAANEQQKEFYRMQNGE